MKIVTTHTPIGVVGAICPWNFPLILSTAKIAASLLMGNCIIVKPSPFTPYSVLKFAEITMGIVPPGVFQTLNGGNELGAHMTLHPNIQKITFTGSTSTGKKIMESASKTLKSLTLELGGNDATIILPDVDLGSVVPQVATGCLFNAGQMCVATKRIYVHEDIFEAFMERFVAEVRKFSIDAPAEAPSVFGPLQNELQYSVVSNIIEDCWLKGYKIVTGGGIPKRPGLFLEPTIVDRPPDDSRLVTEEQFGNYLSSQSVSFSFLLTMSPFSRTNYSCSILEDGGRGHSKSQQHINGPRGLCLGKKCQRCRANRTQPRRWQPVDK